MEHHPRCLVENRTKLGNRQVALLPMLFLALCGQCSLATRWFPSRLLPSRQNEANLRRPVLRNEANFRVNYFYRTKPIVEQLKRICEPIEFKRNKNRVEALLSR